ncbi:hypothetical protein AUEXF2481DRAFT_32132 [Aureobasidium subglaciale EXF-2481]|uniref:Uncharacterized protein n=1 Tax=Aureobasidium subglaciale (strain EXF-2481) TaxID=1043005 RepID=A0A074Y428_AURSE|nr:uncharacterized protein AUEXF2481DRAFT_32132 [Aureobasidium subglaciale EXF-2481]KAI5197066.1 hypothetical protein E4T38_08198 [Aureobasidium subglaciale]KAI5215763.1 hypothetical protein E4T40_08208 [Aureobasidium subglaciale]KAI5219025.1 hypothetical protein E4T41_08123 [Aureobasidium subglaciale]KAI5256583.1 hypothetical protein E4T46_08099 [Aureobasidium subglaciale]KEQ92548.1 hypothetical protein AUEXF2481DRAFT_32132 [Aureobasidium subglaciale EXF-2481]
MSIIFLRPIFLIALIINLALLALTIWGALTIHNSDIWIVFLIALILGIGYQIAYVHLCRKKATDPEHHSRIFIHLRNFYDHSSDSSDGIDSSSVRFIQRPRTSTPESNAPTLVGHDVPPHCGTEAGYAFRYPGKTAATVAHPEPAHPRTELRSTTPGVPIVRLEGRRGRVLLRATNTITSTTPLPTGSAQPWVFLHTVKQEAPTARTEGVRGRFVLRSVKPAAPVTEADK